MPMSSPPHSPCRRTVLTWIGSGLAPIGVTGCGVVSAVTTPQMAPTAVPRASFEVVADADLNPDQSGRPKPVLLRLYELRAPASFERASFVDLLERDEAQLGQEFVRREELLIAPGERRVIDRSGDNQVRAFGWFAAYRDLERSTWRSVVDAPGSVEMRRSWMGLGPTVRLRPVAYRVQVSRDAIRVQPLLKLG